MKKQKFSIKVTYLQTITKAKERKIVREIDRAISKWLSSQVSEEFASWFK